MIDQNKCSGCIGCQTGDVNGCVFWWEFGYGDDFNKTLSIDIPDDWVYQSGDRTIVLELYAISSSYSALLGKSSTLRLTVQGPDDVQWSALDKAGVLGGGDTIAFTQQGFNQQSNYTCVFWSLDPVTEMPDAVVHRSSITFDSGFVCNTPTDWISTVKILYLQVEDAAPLNPFEQPILYYSGISGAHDFVKVQQFWTSVSPAQTSAGGVGSNLTVVGEGFTPLSRYFCQWCVVGSCTNASIDKTVQARVFNSTSLTCRPPVWTAGSQSTQAFFRVLLGQSVTYERNSSISPTDQMCKSNGDVSCTNGNQGSAAFYFGWSWKQVTPSSVAAAGGQTITLTGEGLRSCSDTYTCYFTSDSISVNSSATLVNDEVVKCDTPYWSYAANTATVSLQCGTLVVAKLQTSSITFLPVNVTGISPSVGLNTTGGDTLTIDGSSFGIPIGSSFSQGVDIRVGYTACASPLWLSQSSIKCSVAPGISTQHQGIDVSVTLAERTAILSDSLRYQVPLNLEFTPVPKPTLVQRISDQPLITITGSGFGPSKRSANLTVFLNNTACETTRWVNDATILCTPPEPFVCDGPFGGSASISVLVADTSYQVAASTGTASVYVRPEIASLLANSSAASVSFISPTVGADVTITGADFGPAQLNHSFTIGDTDAHSVMWTSDSSIQCSVHPGTGKDHKVKLHSLGCTFEHMGHRFSYSSPVMTSITPNCLPLVGSGMITLFGSNFGIFNDSDVEVGLEGGVCTNVTWSSDTSIMCNAMATQSAALDAFYPTTTVDDVQGTAQATFKFFSNPSLNRISQAVVDVNNTLVVLTGVGFGLTADLSAEPHVPVAIFGGTVSASTIWRNDTTLVTLVPPGAGGQLRKIELQVRGFTTTLVAAW